MHEIDDPSASSPACRPAPDDVWETVREAYLAGMSAPECCRRYGVGLTALRKRAARQGWRRADQPWVPHNRLDPWDEGVELESRVEGDLDRIHMRDLSWIAHRRMMRAVLRGDAAEALRWRRVQTVMDAEEAEVARFLEQEAAIRFMRDDEAGPDEDAAEAHDAHDPHGVFAKEA
ncbi:MAG: hypothetical protein ACOH1E_11790 [Brevundimonas sp.]